jgi:Reverse transcriptase (RNA-dependent DNA polymerase)
VEKSTLTEGPLVLVPRGVALEAIAKGADLVNIFPVYEEKEKEGKTIYKVRLVGDGRMHKNTGSTYAETPSREEFRIFMHLVAMNGWDFYHVDEKRAFLSAKHSGPDVIAKLGRDYFQVRGALYGLKSAPRDYQNAVIGRLVDKMKFTRLGMCSCIYIRRDSISNRMVYAYDFVDDFVWTGSDTNTTEKAIEEYRLYADCTPNLKNPEKVLGMEITRDFHDKTISLSLAKKANEMFETTKLYGLFDRFNILLDKTIDVPLTSNNVHVGDEHFEDGSLNEDICKLCNQVEINQYLTLVGGLLWQLGVRWDMIFGILYLTWSTHKPRVHHLKMATKIVLLSN